MSSRSTPLVAAVAAALLAALASSAASAPAKKNPPARAEAKPEQKTAAGDAKPGKPAQSGAFGDWTVFVAQGAKDKTCYALATPKERAPAALKRDPAFIFISSRPAEKVRNEVSIIMGFAVKEGGAPRAEIGGANFDLVAKGANAWIKNQAEEAQLVEAMRKGARMTVKAASLKGNVTTDSYSLGGLSDALDRIQKDCP